MEHAVERRVLHVQPRWPEEFVVCAGNARADANEALFIVCGDEGVRDKARGKAEDGFKRVGRAEILGFAKNLIHIADHGFKRVTRYLRQGGQKVVRKEAKRAQKGRKWYLVNEWRRKNGRKLALLAMRIVARDDDDRHGGWGRSNVRGRSRLHRGRSNTARLRGQRSRPYRLHAAIIKAVSTPLRY